ncbi:hypothetical protein ACIA8G_06195 [Lentzea sp. NPDC051213]|uniref:hypothetical protein n=1 Tax=Lentzea sp. NPDC051213 TaxID=3364126 RepID=UPI00379ADA2E
MRLAAAMNDRWFIDRVEETLGWQACVDCEAQFSTVSEGIRVWVAIAPPPGRLLLLGELVTDLDAPAREPVRGVRPHARDRRRPNPVRRRYREVLARHRILVDAAADESAVEGKLVGSTHTPARVHGPRTAEWCRGDGAAQRIVVSESCSR